MRFRNTHAHLFCGSVVISALSLGACGGVDIDYADAPDASIDSGDGDIHVDASDASIDSGDGDLHVDASDASVDSGAGDLAPFGFCDGSLPQPVLYYRFDDCSRHIPDIMGTGHDLQLAGGRCEQTNSLSDALDASWGSDASLGCFGAQNSCAQAPDADIFRPQRFTVAAWVQSPDWARCPGDTCSIVSKGNTDDATTGYWLRVIDGFVDVSIAIPNSGVEHELRARSALQDGVWHHVAATFDGARMAIYIDGRGAGSMFIDTGIEYGQEAFLVGAMTGRFYNHNGLIDELQLWDFALSDAQIEEVHAAYTECR